MKPKAFTCIPAMAIFAVLAAQWAPAQTYNVLYDFTGGKDGGFPEAGVVLKKNGTIYGTTAGGGKYGNGVVFRVSPSGVEKVLHAFKGGADGSTPRTGLIHDNAWNLYGTTEYGGAYGQGTVFKVTPSGTETVLYSFAGGADGSSPPGGVVLHRGYLYGTTAGGGASSSGTLFQLDPTSGAETVLWSFTGGADGAYPHAGVVFAGSPATNAFGTTLTGGTYGWGTVYQWSPGGSVAGIYSFGTQSNDGAQPWAALTWDKVNNLLWGTAYYGGTYGDGTVFVTTTGGGGGTMYSFGAGSSDGAYPYAGVVLNPGSTAVYGTNSTYGGNGTLYEVDLGGNETVLHSFGPSDGDVPYGGVAIDVSGNLYGTTQYGGAHNAGVVYKWVP